MNLRAAILPRHIVMVLGVSSAATWARHGLAAQGVTSAAIEGLVADSSGTPVPGAEIVVSNDATGERWTTRSRATGRFAFEHVSPGGPYTVLTLAIGFRPARIEGLLVAVGQRRVIELLLTRAPATLEPLTISVDQHRRLSPGRTGPEQALTAEEIARLPNIGRNLANLSVGSPHAGRFGSQFAGWSNLLTTFEVDGGQATDSYSGGIPGLPLFTVPLPLAAIADFAVATAPFDVRRGHINSGLVSLGSLSGTNRWESSVFGTAQNDALVARDTAGNRVAPFARWTLGSTLGGPILKNRLQIFLAVEFEHFGRADRGPFVTDTAGGAELAAIGVSYQSAQRFSRILADRWGLGAGTLGVSNTVGPRYHLFGKLSLQLGPRGVVEFSQRVAEGEESGTIRRLARGREYHTGSTTREDLHRIFESRAVWRVQPANGWSNELIIALRSLQQNCRPAGRFPRILVAADEGALLAGADSACGTTRIRQASLELTNHATFLTGRHLITAGLHGELFRVEDPLLIGSQGSWRFASLDAFEAGVASQYDRVLPGPLAPDGPATAFTARSFGAYAQDRFSVTARLAMTIGLRADIPFLPQHGRTNPALLASLGLDTGAPPTGNVLWSPRVGINWNVTGSGSTYLRGGAGLFSGRPPYRWLSGVYHGSGGEQVRLLCRGSEVPPFEPRNQPNACGTGAQPVGQVSAFDPGLRFPQTAQFAFGVDHRLPGNAVVSGDLLYGLGVSQFAYADANLGSPVSSAAGEGGRPMYGSVGTDGTGFPVRRDPAFGTVTYVHRGSGDRSLTLSIQFQKRLGSRWGLDAGYGWNRSRDRQSLSEYEPLANLGITPLEGTHEDRRLGVSFFDNGHRIYGIASVILPLRTTLSLLYTGGGGAAYSYVIEGDANADGLGASALTGFNDLVYVPARSVPGGDILLVTAGGVSAAAPVYARLDSLIEAVPCLRERRGQLAARNGCRNGWVGFFNARATTGLPLARGHHVEVEIDAFNLPNLLNHRWGRYTQVTAGQSVRLLRLVGSDPAGQRGVYQLLPLPRPQVIDNISRWRFQLTARYRYRT